MSRFGASISSWWMSAMPSRFASRTPESTTGLPSSWISPSSGRYAPPRIFISVLLPAPFSPMSASTSPAESVSETSSKRDHAGEALGDARHSKQRRVSNLPTSSLAMRCACGRYFFISASRVSEVGDVGLVDDLDARVDDLGRRGSQPSPPRLVASSCIHLLER